MKRFLEIFQEESGAYSAIRVLLLAWGFGAFVVWASLCLIKQTFMPIDTSLTFILGILMTGKVIQKPMEKP